MPIYYEDKETDHAIKPAWYLDTNFVPGNPTFRVLYCHGSFATYSIKNLPPEEILVLHDGQHIDFQSKFPYQEAAPSIKANISIDPASAQASRVGDFIPAIGNNEQPPWFPAEYKHLFEEFRRQYCFTCEDDGDIFIFPCALIGAIYFFVTKDLAQYVFSQSIKKASIETVFNTETGIAAIEIPNNLLAIDAFLFARFQYNDISIREANRILNRIRVHSQNKVSNENILPLMINIPFSQQISFNVEALELRLPSNKKVHYVQTIVEEDSNYPFSTLIIRKVTRTDVNRKALPKLNDLVNTPVKDLLRGKVYPNLSYNIFKQSFPGATIANPYRNNLQLIKEAC